MNTSNGWSELTTQEQELLLQIDAIVFNVGGDQQEINSLSSFCGHLARTAPQADEAFRRQLESQLIAKFKSEVETNDMYNVLAKGHRTSGLLWRQRFANSVIALQRLRTFKLAFGLAAAVLACGLLMAAPAAQATVYSMLQRFGLVLIASTPQPAASTTPPAETAQASEVKIPMTSLAEAQQKVPFPIPLPTWLPEGLTLRGALVGIGPSGGGEEAPTSVVLSFGQMDEASNTATGGMFIQITAGTQLEGGYAVPSSETQEVTIRGLTALYVKGGWMENGEWNDASDGAMLSWEEDGFTYVLSASGLGLNFEDLARIAESLQ